MPIKLPLCYGSRGVGPHGVFVTTFIAQPQHFHTAQMIRSNNRCDHNESRIEHCMNIPWWQRRISTSPHDTFKLKIYYDIFLNKNVQKQNKGVEEVAICSDFIVRKKTNWFFIIKNNNSNIDSNLVSNAIDLHDWVKFHHKL